MKRILLVFSLLAAFGLAACDQSQQPTTPEGSALKALVLKDMRWRGAFLNECCGRDEIVVVTGVAHIVFNENGEHVQIQDIEGHCLFDDHAYEAVGTAVANLRFVDGVDQITFHLKMINDDGCSFALKMHYKLVYNEDLGEWELVYDHSEITCEERAE